MEVIRVTVDMERSDESQNGPNHAAHVVDHEWAEDQDEGDRCVAIKGVELCEKDQSR